MDPLPYYACNQKPVEEPESVAVYVTLSHYKYA